MNKKTKNCIRKIVGIPLNEGLSLESFILNWRLKIGRYIYKKKYTAKDVVEAMQKMGMKEGSVVFIQSRWAEFYNCTSDPEDLIDAILEVIGPDGTLGMACMPMMQEGKLFNVKRTPTNAGFLAEVFRRYPGVKRSINVRHSVCAVGPKAEYLCSEHHLGETAWDKKSPYYKLAELKALVFGLGLGKYWIGTIVHCVDSLLRGDVLYYTDLFFPEKTEYHYIDYDGVEKSYWNYDMPETGPKIRIDGYFKTKKLATKYLNRRFMQVSNLQLTCYDADDVVKTVVELGRKGIDCYWKPSKRGYKFEK